MHPPFDHLWTASDLYSHCICITVIQVLYQHQKRFNNTISIHPTSYRLLFEYQHSIRSVHLYGYCCISISTVSAQYQHQQHPSYKPQVTTSVSGQYQHQQHPSVSASAQYQHQEHPSDQERTDKKPALSTVSSAHICSNSTVWAENIISTNSVHIYEPPCLPAMNCKKPHIIGK